MLFALRVLTCLVAMLAASIAIAQDKSFTHAGVQADAKRYETYLRANWQPGTKQGRELRAEGSRLLAAGADFRAASRSFAHAVVADANDAEAWTGLARALLAIKPDQGSERYELPVNASGAAWNAYTARAGAGGQVGRAVGAARGVQAALLLAPGHRRAAGQHRPQQDGRGAGGAGEARRRARLPHRRVQGRHRRRAAAAVHPVLRAAGAGNGRLGAVFQGQRQGPAGGERRGAPDLPRRLRSWPALRGAGEGRAAVGHQGRDAAQDRRARRLRQGPLAVRARHRARLRAAEPRPAGHPAGHGQHREGEGRGLSHRRPQHRAGAAERRFPEADLVL